MDLDTIKTAALDLSWERMRDIWRANDLADELARRLGADRDAVARALSEVACADDRSDCALYRIGDIIAVRRDAEYLQIYEQDGETVVKLTNSPIGKWSNGILVSIRGMWAVKIEEDGGTALADGYKIAEVVERYDEVAAKYLRAIWRVP
ncbi:MAG: hypothetical protein QXU93_05495 [Thermoproteus sp.]